MRWTYREESGMLWTHLCIRLHCFGRIRCIENLLGIGEKQDRVKSRNWERGRRRKFLRRKRKTRKPMTQSGSWVHCTCTRAQDRRKRRRDQTEIVLPLFVFTPSFGCFP